ncbi:DUF1433 domain-containing protein [Macrococcus capreoli]
MSKKQIFSVIFIICLIIGGVYFRMNHDVHKKEKEIYYNEQKKRITLYLKYNTKEPNSIKSVEFTKVDVGPMGDVVFDGYINSNKVHNFVAYASPEDKFQFIGDMTRSPEVERLLKPAHNRKSPKEIKKELEN